MANNIQINDATGTARTVKTTETAGVNVQHHNVDQIGGVVPLFDSQAQRVVLYDANGNPLLLADDAAFTPGTSRVVPIGALADETTPDTVDEGDIGAPRMTLSRVLRTVPSTDTGGNVYKQEDAVHASGDPGIMALAIRKGSAGPLAGDDGDYAPLEVDANGRLHVNVSDIGKDSADRLRVSLYGKASAAGDTAIRTSAPSADGATAPADGVLPALTFPHLFNGTTWDRQRNNYMQILLVSSARTASTDAVATNYNARGMLLLVNVTARAGATTLTPKFVIYNPVTGAFVENVWNAAAAIDTGSGHFMYYFYPGSAPGAAGLYDEKVDLALPVVFYVRIGHSDASSITYSVGCHWLL